MSEVKRANWSGFIAIILWSLLAILPIMAGKVPPLLLLGLACTCAWIVLFAVWYVRYGGIAKPLSYISWRYFWINAGFLLAAELTLVIAMQAGAPVAAYLALNIWPVLTLIFAAIILKQRLYWWHYVAAIIGTTGVLLLVAPQEGVEAVTTWATFNAIFFGLANAVIWSLYSVLNRQFKSIPADCVALPLVLCSNSALLLHVLLEPSCPLSSLGIEQWVAIVLLGTLPWGSAYALWGYAMRFGEIRMLSIFGYAMPLLGVLWMLLLGYAELTLPVVLATTLILASAILGSKTNNESKPKAAE